MKSRVGLVVVLITLVGLVPASTSGQTQFRYGTGTPLAVYDSAREYGSCTPTATVWTQEIGKSGITRLKTQFAIRGPSDPGYFPSYWKSEWVTSSSFPDDTRNHYAFFTLGFDAITVGNGKQVGVWAKMIGERPSFWRRDARIHKQLGEFVCESTVYNPPVT